MYSIWDWQQNICLNRFSNGNPPGSKINEIRYINEDDQALLMTGSSDGVLKVYRNYETRKRIEIITAFRALPELIPSTRNAGLVFDWQQGQGKALVAGDVKVIRVWNAATEVCTNVSYPSCLLIRLRLNFLNRTFRHVPDLALPR
jgi:regulator-associated protein of mTOR